MNENKIKHYYHLTVIIFLFFTHYSIAEGDSDGNLVSVRWLEKNMNNENILILDASPSKMYAAQHIPGAINADFMTYGGPDIPVSRMEELFQTWGVSPGKKIVIYDQGGSIMATKLLYDLYYYGFPRNDLFILDGGLSKWQEAGLKITNEKILQPMKGSFRINIINEDVRVRLPEFLTATGDKKNYTLVEALEASWHFGELQFFDRPGHIPNGIMLPSGDFYNADKTFKSADEIRMMLTHLDIKPEQQIYTYCGGGIAASVPFFALKFILDFPSVKIFSESELGWLKDERELPIWTYDAPYLLRETDWLKTWGSKMMRMYGVSQVSIVDVRTESEYSERHFPFAINISSNLFENNITNPSKLAVILGNAGVKETDEAVVISRSGLTKESALAFIMLEKLGQKKVSVFIDSFEKWAELGNAIIKDTFAVGSSIQQVSYSINLHNEVIIENANSTKGLYSKIYIASGKDVPDIMLDGKVIHIPYTELVNIEGTPKAAKDIWNILDKAGVSRYAELICYSDDPGEAAVNYFILKLMGYPDIKVLVN